MSTLNSSLFKTILAQVLECKTSFAIWKTLPNLFAAKSLSLVIQTQFQLVTLKKGSESISDYYAKAKSLASTLGVIGHPLSDQEFSIYLLDGHGTDYESIVTSITTHLDSLSPHQIYSYLLNHEAHLTHQTQSLLSGSSISANTTITNSGSILGPSVNHGCKGRNGGRGYSGSRIG